MSVMALCHTVWHKADHEIMRCCSCEYLRAIALSPFPSISRGPWRSLFEVCNALCILVLSSPAPLSMGALLFRPCSWGRAGSDVRGANGMQCSRWLGVKHCQFDRGSCRTRGYRVTLHALRR